LLSWSLFISFTQVVNSQYDFCKFEMGNVSNPYQMIMKQRKANMIGRNSTARGESNFEGADVESGLISEKPIRTMRPRQHRQQSCRLPMLCFGLMVGTFVYCQMLRSFSSNASFQYLRQSNTFVVPKYTEPFVSKKKVFQELITKLAQYYAHLILRNRIMTISHSMQRIW